jgi:hypothetical protein
MSNASNSAPSSSLLMTKEAASHLRLSASTLNKLRIFGGGPVYSKIGGRVVYQLADLDRWVAERRRVSSLEKAAQ